MKQALIGFGLVVLVALVGWLVAFGPTPPCDAMRAEARKLGEAKDTKSKGIAAALGSRSDGTISQIECLAMAVRIKAFGAGGVTVVGPGAASAAKSESKK